MKLPFSLVQPSAPRAGFSDEVPLQGLLVQYWHDCPAGVHKLQLVSVLEPGCDCRAGDR